MNCDTDPNCKNHCNQCGAHHGNHFPWCATRQKR